MGKLALTGNSRTRKRHADLSAAAAFTPADIANLWSWHDASNAGSIISSSGAVSQWNDLSGNGRDVTQATGSAKPTTGTRTQNSLNVLDFDGGDFLARTASIGFATGAYTVFIVTGADADSASFLRFMSFHNGSGNDYDSNNAMTITQGDLSNQFYCFQGAGTVNLGGAFATPLAVWCVRKSTGTNGYQIATPFSILAQTTNSSSGTANGGFVFGAGYESGVLGTSKFNGPIGEVVIYSATLSDADRDSVFTYLKNKWGL